MTTETTDWKAALKSRQTDLILKAERNKNASGSINIWASSVLWPLIYLEKEKKNPQKPQKRAKMEETWGNKCSEQDKDKYIYMDEQIILLGSENCRYVEAVSYAFSSLTSVVKENIWVCYIDQYLFITLSVLKRGKLTVDLCWSLELERHTVS